MGAETTRRWVSKWRGVRQVQQPLRNSVSSGGRVLTHVWPRLDRKGRCCLGIVGKTGSDTSEVPSMALSSAIEVRVPVAWNSVYSESAPIHLIRIHLSPVSSSSTAPQELTKLARSIANFSITSSEHRSSNGSNLHHLSRLSTEGKRLSCIVPICVCVSFQRVVQIEKRKAGEMIKLSLFEGLQFER